MTRDLSNCEAVLTVSDPWEFGTECGTGPFMGKVVDQTPEMIVVVLQRLIEYRGKILRTIVARPRHAGDSPQSAFLRAMPANLMLLPLEVYRSDDLRPAVTKDGVAAIGTIELCRGNVINV